MATRPEERDPAVIAGYLAERDVACPTCAHNLRGGTSWLCPECGTPVELELRSAESVRMTRAWLTAIVLFGASGGVVALFILIVLLMMISGEIGGHRDEAPPLIALGAAAVHTGAVMTYLLACRGRFCLAPRRRQWLIALSALLVPLVALFAGMICAIAMGL